MKLFSAILLVISLLFSACSIKDFKRFDKNIDQNQTVKVIDDESYQKDILFEWKITKGDRVEIHAFNQSSSATAGQLSQLLSSGGQQLYTQRIGDEGMLVGPSGELLLPLVGAIKITGLTESEASKKLTKEYQKYLKNPYVYVKILNQKLFVVGEVRRPGVQLVTHGTMTLFEALALSGDITDFADRTNIKIIRGNVRNSEIREIDLTDFNSLHYASLILRPNDIVYVSPRDQKAKTVGNQEQLPFWQLIGAAITPFTSTAILYGAVK